MPGSTRREQAGGPGYTPPDADAADVDRREAVEEAEGRDFDLLDAAGVEDRGPGGYRGGPSVERDLDHGWRHGGRRLRDP
jgi:hypothetical protein